MSISPGTRLGPYEVLAPLGAGGMGEVWRARDPRLGRDVAIKVLPASLSQDPDRLKRFEQEARAAGALNHPAITAVYDIGTHEASLYVVSELLEGETLRSRLASGPLPPRKAVEYGAQIARGLAAAHEKGIVHRDLKPENLFVTSDGRMKILDFGLVKLTRPEGGAAVTEIPTVAGGGTEPGVVLGTLGYMSPEQVRGQEVDARSDIFSLGTVLYEMLAGKRAFSEASAADTMIAILTKEPADLAAHDRGIPPAIDRIVAHCLEKNPAERFQSARDVAFDLESLSSISTPSGPAAATSAPGAGSRSAGRIRLAAAILVPLATLAAGLAAGRRMASRPPPAFHQLSYQHGLVSGASFAPDGQTIVYSAAWSGGPLQTYLKRPDTPDATPVGPPGANILSISKTGEMALALNCTQTFHAGLCAGTLARAPLTGAAPREILENVLDADWSPDGSSLAIVRDVGHETRLEFPAGKVIYATGGHISHPKFSPKGDRIAFYDHPLAGDDRGAVAVVDVGGKKTTLTPVWESAHGIAWSPSGDEIWFTASPRGPMQALYGVTPAGKLRLINQAPGYLQIHDVSGAGEALVSRHSNQISAYFGAIGGGPDRDLTWLEWSAVRYLSPDGKIVLFDEQAAPTGTNYAACLRKTDGSPVVRLGDGLPQSLSPDGRWVVATLPSEPRTYSLLPTGAGEPRRISFEGIEDRRRAVFLPNGRELLFFGRKANEPLRLFVGGVEGGKARPVTPEVIPGGFAPSPDGNAAAALDSQRVLRIYSLRPGEESKDARPVRGAEPGDGVLVWSADGRGIYVRRGSRGGSAPIFRIDLETGRTELWKEIVPADPAGARITTAALTPDGKFYAYSVGRTLSQLYLVDGLK